MKKLLVLLALACTLVGCQMLGTQAPQPALSPSELPQAGEYLHSSYAEPEQKQVDAFHADNPAHAPGGIVFCGDSITAGFPFDEVLPGQGIINRGIGGDNIWGLLRRLDASAYELRPGKLFVMIGINDIFINKMTPPEYGQLYDYLYAQLKENCPDCTIYVQSLLPVRGRIANVESAQLNANIIEVNRELKAIARKYGLPYLDLHPSFCDENGEMKTECSSDGVHPNRAGFELWAQLLAKPLKNK